MFWDKNRASSCSRVINVTSVVAKAHMALAMVMTARVRKSGAVGSWHLPLC